MKQIVFAILCFVISAQAAEKKREKLHILPDAPGWAYRGQYSTTWSEREDRHVAAAILLGERNMDWLKYMNSFREDGKKIQLTKPGGLTGIPIESPKSYSPEIIGKTAQEIKDQIPSELAAVLYTAGGKFPQNPPVDEETYILWARKIDGNYQTAARWRMMAPWLGQLEFERSKDVRGFYFLTKKTANVENFLRSYNTLPDDQKTQVQQWLEQMCMNTDGPYSTCDSKTSKALSANKAYEFYLKYLPRSQKIWDSNFSLHNPRSEIIWSKSNPSQMIVPFQKPSSLDILNFLKINIEDEWKWDGWQMLLDFRKMANIHVEFEPGAVPHVNGLGGDTIVMDENAPLTEWDVQWTIRHEFGHVLGFIDCYVEFYDSKAEAIVTYQLDVENLMCARSGRMQKSMFETLKSSYLK